MVKNCIIVASGKGKRFGGDIPKQYIKINGKPIWYYSVKSFLNSCKNIIVVVHEDYVNEVSKNVSDFFKNSLSKIRVIKGGKERYNSVLNGLNALKTESNSLVAIHDSVRALIKKETINGAFEMAQKKGNAVVYAPVVDTIKINNNKNYSIVDRDKLLAIQTPQIAKLGDLKKSIEFGVENGFLGTDDSSFLENYGKKISYFKGDKSNIKLTTKEDLDYFIFYINKYMENP